MTVYCGSPRRSLDFGVGRQKAEAMSLPEFSAVRLRSDRFASEGVHAGAVGFILDVYGDGYDVEFSRPDGTTIALLFLEPEDIEPAPEIMPTSERLAVEPR